MLRAELAYFIAHQDELVQLHRGKVLVLKDQTVVGAYATLLRAYLEAQQTYPLGTFMLQRCEPGADAYTVTISTPGIFAAAA